MPGERNAALEGLQSLLEGQIAALEASNQGLKLRERLLEIGRFTWFAQFDPSFAELENE